MCWLLALALIDLDTMTLPNTITASGLVLGWAYQGWTHALTVPAAATIMGHVSWALVTSISASVAALWMFDLIGMAGSRAFGKPAMGGGDSKLAAMMAAWLGFPGLLLATFLAAAMGAFIGGAALAIGALGPKQHIPFGPYLALGAVLTVFYGQQIMTTYISIFFPAGL